MCALRLPFSRDLFGTTIAAILNEAHDPITYDEYSNDLKELIDSLLTKDPEQRISIQELIKVPIVQKAIDALIKEFDGWN